MKTLTISLILLLSINSFSQNSTANFRHNNNSSRLNNNEVTHHNFDLDHTIRLEDADEVPTYKGCEDTTSNNEKVNCLITNLSIHARSSFINSGVLQKNKIKSGTNRLRVLFIIDEKGRINVKQIFGQNCNILSKEMKKAIESAPILSPAKLSGQNVPVKFSIKIPFIV